MTAGAAPDGRSRRHIHAIAEAHVSDGSRFVLETLFHARNEAAVRHVRDDVRTVAVEGPFGWTSEGGVARLGSDAQRGFALGHQFHAFLLAFEEIIDDAEPMTAIPFGGGERRGIGGPFPYGGSVQLIEGDDGGWAAGLRFEFPGAAPIEVVFADWRPAGGQILPFGLRLDDGERTFEYAYTTIDVADASPGWFFEAVPEPPIDQIRAYRRLRSS